MSQKQFTVKSNVFDFFFISGIGFICSLLVLLFQNYFLGVSEIKPWQWLLLILAVDVSHVYSTLYRTYFDKKTRNTKSKLLIAVPIICFLVALILALVTDSIWFWRIMAYTAVFHFIRQQYGFMKLYSKFEIQNKLQKYIDVIAIYAATVYPLLHWHLSPNKHFNWFTETDFFRYQNIQLDTVFFYIYMLINVVYITKEITLFIKNKSISIHKNILWLSTLCSWYIGIVYLNNDLAFTFLNTVSHGVPYLALIYVYSKKQNAIATNNYSKIIKLTLSNYGLPLFLLLLFVLGYTEEWLWNMMVWREHASIFPFSFAFDLHNELLLKLVITLLILPQLTHYVLDAFVWKVNKDKELKEVLD